MSVQKNKNSTEDKIISFSFLPLSLRMVAFFFGLFVIWFNIRSFRLSAIGLAFLGMGIFCFFLGLYDNSWFFNLTQKKVIRRYGFVLLPFKKELDFSQVQAVVINEYMRKVTKTSFSEIVVVLKDGTQVKLDYDKTERIKDSVANAEVLRKYFLDRELGRMERSIMEEIETTSALGAQPGAETASATTNALGTQPSAAISALGAQPSAETASATTNAHGAQPSAETASATTNAHGTQPSAETASATTNAHGTQPSATTNALKETLAEDYAESDGELWVENFNDKTN